MKRSLPDIEKLKLFSYAEVANEHPEWTSDKQKEVAYSDVRINNLLKRKMVQYCLDRLINDVGNVNLIDIEFEKKRFEWIVENIQPELIPNLHEYINSEPLTDIYINNWTINKVLEYLDNKRATFINAVTYMIRWKEHGYPNPELFFSQFR